MARNGQIRLSGSSSSGASMWAKTKSTATKLARARSSRAVAKVVMTAWRVEGTPLRVRPVLIVSTAVTLLLLSLLGFHPTLATHLQHPRVPFSDKILHFVGFFLASVQFYAIWLVDERARVEGPVLWRWWTEGVSWGTCGVVGSIGSEFVQALLPYKTFQWGDVIANVLGTSLGLTLARRLTLEHRRRAELRRLGAYSYQAAPLRMGPLDDHGSYSDASSEDDDEDATANLPRDMEEGRANGGGGRARKDSNPWDDADEPIMQENRASGRQIGSDDNRAVASSSKRAESMFGLGADSEDEDEFDARASQGPQS